MNAQGFTIIEVAVVVGVLMVIIAFGAITDLSSFRNDTIQAEESKVVAILQKARSRSMANYFNTIHGVCYSDTDESYVIFRGSSCSPGAATSELVDANETIAEVSNFDSDFPTIVFDQLSGNTSGDVINITDGTNTEEININNAGRIDW